MRRALLAVGVAIVLAGSVVRAQEDDRPTLSVAAFTASQSSLSSQEAAELADDLAARLVDTGRFRVLPREWLPAPTGPAQAIRPAALQDAAILAGIAYLVVPSVAGLPSGSSQRSRSILGVGQAILGLNASRRAPVRCRPARPVQSFALVEVKVIDVESGAVVRTTGLRTRLATPVADAVCASAGVSAALALRASQSRPEVETLKRANEEIANTLALPGRAPRPAID